MAKGVNIDDIELALSQFGGKAHLGQIYRKISENRPEVLSAYKNKDTYQASIRATLEKNSSDSKKFSGADLFCLLERGKGVWGLRRML